MKILEFDSAEEFLASFAEGDLKGFLPAEVIDTKTLTYPVKVEMIIADNMFRLYREPEPEVVTPKAETKKKKLSKGAIAGIVAGVLAAVAIIVGTTLYYVL